nr:uncharacterized protein LOC123757649 [Procambarus clarkii]
MMYFLLALVLITGCVVGGSTALNIDQGCIVRSSVTSEWRWSEAHISVWSPSGSHDHTILTIQVNLGDGYPENYDTITFTTNNISFTRISAHIYKESTTRALPAAVRPGWQELIFRVTTQYEVVSPAINTTFNNTRSQHLPIRSIKFTGSNLTLDCHEKVRVWRVDGKPVVVPLDSSLHHWITTYAKTESSPRLTLGERTINLGWDHNSLTTLGRNTAPLPPFTQHVFTLSCGTDRVIYCDVMLGETRSSTERLIQSQLPGGLLVERSSDKAFYFLLHQEDPFPPAPIHTTILPDTLEATHLPPDNGPTAGVRREVVVVLGAVLAVLVVAFAGTLLWLTLRRRGWQQPPGQLTKTSRPDSTDSEDENIEADHNDSTDSDASVDVTSSPARHVAASAPPPSPNPTTAPTRLTGSHAASSGYIQRGRALFKDRQHNSIIHNDYWEYKCREAGRILRMVVPQERLDRLCDHDTLKKEIRPDYQHRGTGIRKPVLLRCANITTRLNGSNSHQPQRSKLFVAVLRGESRKVQQLVAQQLTVDEDTCVEAHTLGSQPVVDAMSSATPPLSRENLIIKVMKTYEERVEEVMEAARRGLYCGRGGVNSLLHAHDLLAVARDAQGRTVLHYVASSACDESEGPLWGCSDVQHFLDNHQSLLNARDYDGRTCLLLLAEAASNKELKTIWKNKEVPVSEAWVSMAQLLVAKGADAQLKDYNGNLPRTVALIKGNVAVSSYFDEVGDELKDSHQKHFDKIMSAVQKNKLELLKDLLKKRHPLLPLGATCDPLVEAIKKGSLEAVLLLLCAGAPLCGLSLISITALEASHGRSQLPAIFPALMRKEYSNKLRHEAGKATDPGYTALHETVQSLADEVREKGHKFSWEFIDQCRDKKERSEKARIILCKAASLGMSLTCQMLGLEDVYLHPLPSDVQRLPLERLIKSSQYDTLYTLLRDLKMPLVTVIEEKIPEKLSQHVVRSELEQLERFVSRIVTDIDLVKHVKDACDGKLEGNLHETVLASISRLGLVLIFHKIRTNMQNVDVNSIVEELTGTTMLHLAALYGNLGMVEYLLFRGADVQARDKAGLTAAHQAAVKGNMECMEYLHGFMLFNKINLDQPSDAEVTAEELANGYKNQVNDYKLVLLSEEYRLEALSEPLFAKKAKLVLEKKEQELKIEDIESLRAAAREWYCEEVGEKVKQLQNEMCLFLQEVAKTDPRFMGTPFTRSSHAEAKLKLVDSLDIFWEINTEELRDLKIEHEKQVEGQKCIVSLEPFKSQESSETFYFRNSFVKAVRQTLENYHFKLSKLWLIYPYVVQTDIGLSLYFVWYTDGRTALLRVHIVPVIKVDYPDDNLVWMKERQDIIPSLLKECIDHKIPIHLARNSEGSWTYISTKMENRIFSQQLSEDQRLVYLACNMITKILFSCWWFPVQHSRRHGRAWHLYSLNIRTLSDVLLRSLFLEELSGSQEADWEPSKFLERMISIFQRATCISNDGKINRKRNIPLILDPLHAAQDANFIVTAVVKHLKELKDRYSGSGTPEGTETSLQETVKHGSPGTPEGTKISLQETVKHGSPGTPEGTKISLQETVIHGSPGTPEGTETSLQETVIHWLPRHLMELRERFMGPHKHRKKLRARHMCPHEHRKKLRARHMFPHKHRKKLQDRDMDPYESLLKHLPRDMDRQEHRRKSNTNTISHIDFNMA